MHSWATIEVLSFRKKVWLTCCLSVQLLVLLFPTKNVQTPEMHLDLCRRERLWSARHRRIGFRLWLDLLFWIILNHEGITSASKACFCHQDGLFSWKKLFFASSQASLSDFFNRIKCSIEFWNDIDLCFYFDHFVEWIRFFSHPGVVLCVMVHSAQVAV